MVRNRFDRQLHSLNSQMVSMGKLCELAITGATTALATGNEDTARSIIRADAQIDQAERDIEHLCLKLLLQQQPVAKDLRQVSAALKMITDLERIGDQAADIAEIVLTSHIGGSADFPKILEMSEKVTVMVGNAVNAYVNRDVKLADSILAHDDEVDALLVEIRQELIETIIHNGHSSGNDEQAQEAIDIMMIAKYLERIGDHATNVAEWVTFSITGVRANEFDTKIQEFNNEHEDSKGS